MRKVKLDQVFGVSTEQLSSYLVREKVDGLFLSALNSNKQIVVYGSSKQGKTALVTKYTPYDQNIKVSCSPKADIEDIYKSILRQLGIEISTSKVAKSGSRYNIGAVAKIKAILFPISGESSVKSDISATTEKSEEVVSVEFNLSLAQDISELIKVAVKGKFIILEDFHYLSSEVQKQLAFDLRTFQEMGIRFIVLGVWREKNRLAQYNGDLLDRIIEVPVEPWLKEEFLEVIHKGEAALNIKFSYEVYDELLANAFDSIGVVQELLRSVCEQSRISETQKETKAINDQELLKKAIRRKSAEYAARHVRALEMIAEGRKPTSTKNGLEPLCLPYYSVKAILTIEFDSILRGIRRELLEAEIKKLHHRPADVRPGDMSNLLHNFALLQLEKDIRPPIFDYNRDSRVLKIIDSTFYFFMRNVNKTVILDNLINPLETNGNGH
ncbi:MAG: hypothetical protein RIN56_15150 [Sporomusaceae bacterium]|nr:hypothetical protein [Sporomusaceae bacterium]